MGRYRERSNRRLGNIIASDFPPRRLIEKTVKRGLLRCTYFLWSGKVTTMRKSLVMTCHFMKLTSVVGPAGSSSAAGTASAASRSSTLASRPGSASGSAPGASGSSASTSTPLGSTSGLSFLDDIIKGHINLVGGHDAAENQDVLQLQLISSYRRKGSTSLY